MNSKFQLFFFPLLVLGMFLLAVLAEEVRAQEFDCEVDINTRQISGSSFDYVRELGPVLERYINENRWTNDRFESHERIRCRIQIMLTGVDSRFNYSAEVVFNVRRPVYNTMQETASIVLSDNNWHFNYPQNKSLIRDDLQFDDLTSFIDFYVYVLLGYDYDSFSELGGSRFYASALDVLELAQNAGAPGWGRAIGAQRNRYGLISDLTNPGYEDLRRSVYRYHRLGLDQFTIDQENARREIMEAVRLIGENKRRVSRNYLFDIFFDTKFSELVALFMDAPVSARLQAYNLLREVDPGHTSAYERLRSD